MSGQEPAPVLTEPSEREQVITILDRLDGLFGDPAENPQGPAVRVLHGDTLAEPDATDAQQWQPRIDVIRKWSRGESVSWRRTAGTNAAISAAQQMQLLLPGPHQSDANLAAAYSDVCRLFELVASVAPIACQSCGKTFHPGRAGETHCPTCKSKQGNYGEIWTKLHCHWHHGQQIRVSNQADWDDFCAEFRKKYGKLPEAAAEGWKPNPKEKPSTQSPPLWKEFELDCRGWLLARGVEKSAWEEALHRTPIADVVQWLRDENEKPERERKSREWREWQAAVNRESMERHQQRMIVKAIQSAATAAKGATIGEQSPDDAAFVPAGKLDCSHSPDFRSVRWFGANYSFTANQAACVKLLWESWEKGSPEVGGKTLLEAADANTDRLDHVFRGCPAWDKMIVAGGTRGSYRLREHSSAEEKPTRGPPRKKSGRGAKKHG